MPKSKGQIQRAGFINTSLFFCLKVQKSLFLLAIQNQSTANEQKLALPEMDLPHLPQSKLKQTLEAPISHSLLQRDLELSAQLEAQLGGMNNTQFIWIILLSSGHLIGRKKNNVHNGEIGIQGWLRHLMQSYALIAKGTCCAWDGEGGESQASA